MPEELIKRYARLAAARALLERQPDESWFAEIREFPGVWAEGSSEEAALVELQEVVADWVVLKLQAGDRDLPVLGDIDFNGH
jgi:predicted RNase H-like HicB family nuclease